VAYDFAVVRQLLQQPLALRAYSEIINWFQPLAMMCFVHRDEY
jgi:hypothetical protein